jgi:2-polyprenyl-3-methyl-5-hydroxy-6-metoxy-1,4-benzoquinol methylase
MSTAPEGALGRPLVLDLGQAVTHSGHIVSGKGSLQITTAADQWSYAAGFRFAKAGLPCAERVFVRVELTVQQGRVGIVFVKDDLREILGNDEERSPLDGDCVVEIDVDDVPSTGWIVIRNNTPGGVSSRCSIRGITIYGLAPSPLRGFSEWAPKDETGKRLFEALRQKWNEVPIGLSGRRKTLDLMKLDDARLKSLWLETHREATQGPGYAARGWYHDLYSDVLRGKRVLDVGSGLGIDAMTFAKAGASVTCVDIASSNLDLLKRLSGILDVQISGYLYLEDLSALDRLPADFDVIWCQGSMLHVPFEFSQREAQRLLRHLRIGGRWIELTYPRERWQRDGSLPFDQWGKCTDGAATPWAQWYDLPQVLERLQPAEFQTVLAFNFHNNDFNWFDLLRTK